MYLSYLAADNFGGFHLLAVHEPIRDGIGRSRIRLSIGRRFVEWKAVAIRYRRGERADVCRIGVAPRRCCGWDPLRQRSRQCCTGSKRERPRTK